MDATCLSNDAMRTVLVVEDESALRDATREILERNGYAVVTAGDGQSALLMSNRHEGTIDVLLTDVVMPKMQGTELADAIRLQRPGIAVVYMTGYAKEGFRAGGGVHPAALVEKPVSEARLLDAVRRQLPD